MQFSFEFNAPRYCFLQIPHKREMSDYSVRNSDQNDFWFMHTNEKGSGLNNLDLNTQSSRQQLPVVRRSIKKEEVQLVELALDQPRINQDQENFEKNQNKQAQVLNNQQAEIEPKMQPKMRRNPFRKTVIQLEKKQPIVKHLSEDKQKKTAHNKMPARSKSNLPKNNYNDSRPCPFPPRIQREWQNKFGKKWYRLSPPSKVQAQKQMKQIQAEKNRQKSNSAKDNPFLRKQITKRK